MCVCVCGGGGVVMDISSLVGSEHNISGIVMSIIIFIMVSAP